MPEAARDVKRSVDDAADSVNPAPVIRNAPPVTFHVDVPKVKLLVVADVAENVLTVNVKLAVFTAPATIVQEPPVANASASVQPPPVPLKLTLPGSVLPAEVIVLPTAVAAKVNAPEKLNTVVEVSANDPLTASVGVVPLAKVTVPAETVKSRHRSAPVMVTVYVAAWSKNTESAAVGTDAPPAPPEMVDQLVVDVVFHVPVPPTQ